MLGGGFEDGRELAQRALNGGYGSICLPDDVWRAAVQAEPLYRDSGFEPREELASGVEGLANQLKALGGALDEVVELGPGVDTWGLPTPALEEGAELTAEGRLKLPGSSDEEMAHKPEVAIVYGYPAFAVLDKAVPHAPPPNGRGAQLHRLPPRMPQTKDIRRQTAARPRLERAMAVSAAAPC